MERRWTTRARINLPVDLSFAGTYTGGCRTRDLGLGGLFLELPPALGLTRETQVELVFKLDTGGEITKHRIKARVVRVEEDGTGMMFRDNDAVTFRSLQEILRHPEDSAST